MDDIWSEQDFLQERINYAQELEIDFQPTYMTFAYYSQSCPLKLRTKYLEVFKDYTYQNDFYVTVGYVTEDYFSSMSRIIQTFQWLDDNLMTIRNRFGVVEEESVSVHLTDSLGGRGNISFKGLCLYGENTCNIQAKTIHCLAHEYIHYIYWLCGGTKDIAYEQWINEVVAHYYTMAADFETYVLLDANVDSGRIEAIVKLIGEKFNEPSDYIKLTQKTVQNRENVQYTYYLKTEYILCAAFGDYFIQEYGEDAFITGMLEPSNIHTITGKILNEIVNDWCLDMDIQDNN